MTYKLSELNAMLDRGMAVFEHYYQKATSLASNGFVRKVKSPFFRNGTIEEHPSFHVFLNKTKDVYLFKDHGIDKVGTHWQFVMDLYGIDFKDAVKKVKHELLGIHDQTYGTIPIVRPTFNYQKPEQKSGRVEITTCVKDYSNGELTLWKSFGVSKSTLDIFHCHSLNHYDISKENKTFRVGAKTNSPMFDFQINGRHKINQPLGDPKYKWTSNLIAEEDVFGFDLIPKECEHLFLIGGNKDTMSFHENIGYPVIALASESTNLTESLYVFLKRMAKNIWVFYDNDEQGYKKAKRFEEQYNLPYLNELLVPFNNAGDFGELVHDSPTKVNDFRIFLNDYINKSNNI